MSIKPAIAILLGDASGIGPEIVAKAAAAGTLGKDCTPLIIGDERVFRSALLLIGREVAYTAVENPSQLRSIDGLALLHQPLDADQVRIGEVSPAAGEACVRGIRTVVELYRAGHIQGACFAPLNKTAMKKGGSPCSSELELLAKYLNYCGPFCEINMLDGIFTTRVTSHIPLQEVSRNLSVEKILESICLAHQTLVRTGKEQPHIGVSALNPHAGENGLCGSEEIELIEPAVEEAMKRGILAEGPISADVLFMKAFAGQYDAAVTMYHDQGQIALKLKGFDRGVTIMGGLPLPVTTTGHGTAFDIAGKGVAQTGSFENALAAVCKMAGSKI